ncbi:putative ATP-dependent permease [Podospora australis]|uniref:ATP-dependent permease n=1 Tax=Podospora australis TaxID=1536484 RepID=A0AAN6WV88_9PEZI|nr:putative ATP-dependent permease [Podospora australis]
MVLTPSDPRWWEGFWPCYNCCRNAGIWASYTNITLSRPSRIPSLGTFSPQCLGLIGHIPLWIAILTVTLRYGVGPAWSRYRPAWLRKFAVEPITVSADQETGQPQSHAGRRWTASTLTLLLLNVITTLLAVVGAVIWKGHSQIYLIPAAPSVVSALILAIERPSTVPGTVFVVQLALILVEFALFMVVPGAVGNGWLQILSTWAGGCLLPLFSLGTMANMPIRDPSMDFTGISKPFAEPSHLDRSPEDRITLFQWMTVSWLAPLIKNGSKKKLNEEDVWFLAYEFHHRRLHMLFRDLTGSVLSRLLKANGLDLLIITSLGILETSMEVAEPVFLKQLLGALTSSEPSKRTAMTYAGILLFTRLCRAQSGVFTIWFSRRAYERSRGEMITMVYEKTLRRKAFTFPGGDDASEGRTAGQRRSPSDTSTASTLTNNSDETDIPKAEPSRYERCTSWLHHGWGRLGQLFVEFWIPPKVDNTPASTGKILNVIRNDAYDIAQRFWDFPDFTTKPLGCVLGIYFIWRILGPTALSAIVVLIIGIIVTQFLTNLLGRMEDVRRSVADVKLERISQFVESIRHLRWYNWQDPWLNRIMDSRRAELVKRVMTSLLDLSIKTLNQFTGFMLPVVAFLAYTVISGKPLTVEVAFPALDLFYKLQGTLRELPKLIVTLTNSRVSMRRLENFMHEEEVEGYEDESLNGPLGELEITIEHASFSWPSSVSAKKTILKDVSLKCRAGLTMVCGKVGSGKTALLQAILGELDQDGGHKTVPNEMIAYCAQTAWLESMSIRENILFSSVYEKERFERVIDACCLREDLEQWKSKDLTLIGENGVGLSGGQKARVSLARAIYSPARILLLDDPIAALDHHTATSILQNLFSKNSTLTAGRIVIFVTHRVDIVRPYAYQIVEVMDGGRVGTFDRADEQELEHLAMLAAEDALGTLPNDEDKPPAAKFLEDEHRADGGVLLSVYWRFIKAGTFRWWCTTIVFFTIFRAANVLDYWFLKEWGEAYNDKPVQPNSIGVLGGVDDMQYALVSQQIIEGNGSTEKTWLGLRDRLPSPNEDVKPWLWVFFAISVIQVLAQCGSDVAQVSIMYKAGKSLFEQAMQHVANATFRYYDITPNGRLMNRLTSDMGTIDGQVGGQLTRVAYLGLGWVAAISVIAFTTPSFLFISIIMTLLFVSIFRRFLPTSQSLRRLEGASLSPLFSNFGALVEGLTTVRAFRAQAHFQNRIFVTTDTFQRMDHFYWSLQSWLQYRFDIISAVTTFALTLSAVSSELSGGTVGFVLAAASNLVKNTHELCKAYGNLQMQFVSVERVVELLGLEQEPRGAVVPPASWPVYGDGIEFDHVTLRYAPELDPVLKDVTFAIPGGANVAVTGRTGSGKSTLAQSLLGTLHPDTETGGTIRIGPVDLANVDKHVLRRNITFVAQDPVLFAGTLRDNLDPMDERDETEQADILERVLGPSGSFTLDSRVDGGGKNMSQGQRQLVGLGRAILRRSPIVILDEATASIDRETATYIQRLLREELKHSTVITIAHKAEAVADANFEIVLDKGRIVKAGPR